MRLPLSPQRNLRTKCEFHEQLPMFWRSRLAENWSMTPRWWAGSRSKIILLADWSLSFVWSCYMQSAEPELKHKVWMHVLKTDCISLHSKASITAGNVYFIILGVFLTLVELTVCVSLAIFCVQNSERFRLPVLVPFQPELPGRAKDEQVLVRKSH